jgi:hypothetical protein
LEPWNIVILSFPLLILGVTLTALPPAERSLTFGLKVFGVMLFFGCYWVLWLEYTKHFRLHRLKSPLVDTALILFISFSIWQFVANAGVLRTAVSWLSGFLLTTCLWEAYTMRVGFEKYFKQQRPDFSLRSWLRLLSQGLFPLRLPENWSHWDEYRYWLVIDGSALAALLLLIAVFPSSLGAKLEAAFKILLIVIGVAVGFNNLYRYLLLFRRPVR